MTKIVAKEQLSLRNVFMLIRTKYDKICFNTNNIRIVYIIFIAFHFYKYYFSLVTAIKLLQQIGTSQWCHPVPEDVAHPHQGHRALC